MNIDHRMARRIVKTAASLIAGVSMTANAGLFGLGGVSWKEEVLLHDGSKVMAERWHKRGGRHEITSGPPVKEQRITFQMPATNKTISWDDEYSEEVGSSNFELLALHVLNNTPYLVASPYGCLSYNKWGRPNPPYVTFKHDGNVWQRIQLSELPVEFKTINLVIGTSNNEKELDRLGKVSVSDIEKMNRYIKQPELRSILREPIKPGTSASNVNCPDYSSPRYMSPKAPNPVPPSDTGQRQQ